MQGISSRDNHELVSSYLSMVPLFLTMATSVFGAEFVAMKVGMVMMCGLWYKIQMMGVPLLVPTYIYGDNMSVVHNTQHASAIMLFMSWWLWVNV
jgi:hypothetical protein